MINLGQNTSAINVLTVIGKPILTIAAIYCLVSTFVPQKLNAATIAKPKKTIFSEAVLSPITTGKNLATSIFKKSLGLTGKILRPIFSQQTVKLLEKAQYLTQPHLLLEKPITSCVSKGINLAICTYERKSIKELEDLLSNLEKKKQGVIDTLNTLKNIDDDYLTSFLKNINFYQHLKDIPLKTLLQSEQFKNMSKLKNLNNTDLNGTLEAFIKKLKVITRNKNLSNQVRSEAAKTHERLSTTLNNDKVKISLVETENTKLYQRLQNPLKLYLQKTLYYLTGSKKFKHSKEWNRRSDEIQQIVQMGIDFPLVRYIVLPYIGKKVSPNFLANLSKNNLWDLISNPNIGPSGALFAWLTWKLGPQKGKGTLSPCKLHQKIDSILENGKTACIVGNIFTNPNITNTSKIMAAQKIPDICEDMACFKCFPIMQKSKILSFLAKILSKTCIGMLAAKYFKVPGKDNFLLLGIDTAKNQLLQETSKYAWNKVTSPYSIFLSKMLWSTIFEIAKNLQY